MKFVKGNKKVPFYSSKDPKIVETLGPVQKQSKPVEVSQKPDVKPLTNADKPNNGKSGSVTDVLNRIRVEKSAGAQQTEYVDVKSSAESDVTVTDNELPYNPFTQKLKELDELAPLPVKTRKTAVKQTIKHNTHGKKSRVAAISMVASLAFIIIAGSVFGLFYFSGYNPLSLFETAPAVETMGETDEEKRTLPTGTPVIEYELLNQAVENVEPTLNLSLASAEDLLEISVVDSTGQSLESLSFKITVIDPTGVVSNHVIDKGDAYLKMEDLDEEGRYTVILHPVDGYPVVEPKFIDVKFTIDTNPLDADDLKDIIKDEADIDASKEDAEYNGSAPSVDGDGTAPPAATVVTPVPPELDGTTTTVGGEIYYLPKNSNTEFTITEGSYAGDYIFTLDGNGRITGAVKVVELTRAVNSALEVDFLANLAQLFTLTTDGISDSITSLISSIAPVDSSSLVTPESSSEIPSSSDTSSSSSSSSSVTTPSSSSSSTSSSGSNSDDGGTEQPETTTEPVPYSTLFSGTSEKPIMQEPFSSFADKYESAGDTINYGWHTTVNGDEYYYDINGDIVTGYVSINGVFYTFGSDGKLQKGITDGIDVSKWQGSYIDWNAVKASGIEYVIIRVGYRGYSYGTLVEDIYYRQNINGAIAAGLDVGVYIFSQAITVQEAIEEASFCLQLTQGYTLKYGITFDTEYEANGGRANNISTDLRTQIANAFCDTVRAGGRVPMIYASKSWFIHQLDYTKIDHNRIWLAHYTAQTDFQYRYDLWQYTSTGIVPGVSGGVDMNYSYITP